MNIKLRCISSCKDSVEGNYLFYLISDVLQECIIWEKKQPYKQKKNHNPCSGALSMQQISPTGNLGGTS